MSDPIIPDPAPGPGRARGGETMDATTANTGAKARAIRLASSIGAVVEFGGDPFEITVEAPDGFHWVEGPHQLVCSTWDCRESRAEMWRDILGRMGLGLEACEPDCECKD